MWKIQKQLLEQLKQFGEKFNQYYEKLNQICEELNQFLEFQIPGDRLWENIERLCELIISANDTNRL